MNQPADNIPPLTPASAMLAELVRRYWVLGMECSMLEIQKLGWFLQRSIERYSPQDDPLDFHFVAHKYGPYANELGRLLDSLDGSYLHCEKRISDASPSDVIWFDDGRKTFLQTYLKTEAKAYTEALEHTAAMIDGFESPYGMELLATVDWLLYKESVTPTVQAVREGLLHWPAAGAGERKNRLFDDRAIGIALERLTGEHRQPMAA